VAAIAATMIPRMRVLLSLPDIVGETASAAESFADCDVVRPQAKYGRSLELLARVKQLDPEMRTKSGLMVGLGEEMSELLDTMRDLSRVHCDLLTIGQYLRPSERHLPVVRYYPPEDFAELKRQGDLMGFVHVESGPLVRSSYHAAEQESAAHASVYEKETP